ncbi:MAG: nucleoside triphosphate pyrophosphatase [Planctomycetota bacterium]
MRRLVLASTSRYRAQILKRIGLPFEAMAPPYEEVNDPSQDPEDLVLEQAKGKAQSLVTAVGDALIIGSDQVAHLDGSILTKPGSFERASEQLTKLQGREHELLTALVVIDATSGRTEQHLERTPIALRPLDPKEIEAYLRRDEPWDCAGSYKAESWGPAIFASQRGDDPNAVIGLPLIALFRLLRELGHNPLLSD